MLSVEKLASAYGRIKALHDVSLDVQGGEIVALIGANGAGKTTLLRAISGVQTVSAGSIRVDNKPIENLSSHARVALGVIQVPEGRQLFAPLCVEDNLKLGAWSRRATDMRPDIGRIYAMFPMLSALRKVIAALEGGLAVVGDSAWFGQQLRNVDDVGDAVVFQMGATARRIGDDVVVVPPLVLERPRREPSGENPTPVYKKWWFWGVIGLAAAGGITAAVLATQPWDPGLPPGALVHDPKF